MFNSGIMKPMCRAFDQRQSGDTQQPSGTLTARRFGIHQKARCPDEYSHEGDINRGTAHRNRRGFSVGERFTNFAQYHRIARCAERCLLGESLHFPFPETRGDTFQAPCRILPVGVASRSPQKVMATPGARQKRGTKLGDQFRVVADRGRQMRVKLALIEAHATVLRATALTLRFQIAQK